MVYMSFPFISRGQIENHSKTICQNNVNFIETKFLCDYGDSKLTLNEIINNGSNCSGLKCLVKPDLSGTYLRPIGSCAQKPSTTHITTVRTTTIRTTRPRTTRTTRPRTTRTTKPRTTRPPRTTKPRTRTTKPPRTKKPRRIPNRFKRVCVYNGRTIKLNQYRSFGKCKYVHCKLVPNYEYAVVFLYEDCNMPKPTQKTTTKATPPPTFATQPYYWHQTYATYAIQPTQNSYQYQPVLGQPVNSYNNYGNSYGNTGSNYGHSYSSGNSYGTGYGGTTYGQSNSYQPLFDQNKIQNYYEKQMKKEVNKLYREILNG